jgi:hypothetical protein
MSTKYLIAGLVLVAGAIFALTRCGSSEPVAKAEPKKTSVAGSFASSESKPAVPVIPQPEQPAPAQEHPFEGYVGEAPPGKVAFGPRPPTPQETAGEAEVHHVPQPGEAPANNAQPQAGNSQPRTTNSKKQ